MRRKVVLIYSGGIDSTTLLYSLISEGYLVKALGVDYGQRHRKELDSARAICESLRIEFQIADLSTIKALFGHSALTDTSVDVPDGAYDVENMKATVVPNRNMLMFAVAISWAIGSGFRTVAYAAHAGDRAVYPDCRHEFVEALAQTAELCDFETHRDPVSFHRHEQGRDCQHRQQAMCPISPYLELLQGRNTSLRNLRHLSAEGKGFSSLQRAGPYTLCRPLSDRLAPTPLTPCASLELPSKGV